VASTVCEIFAAKLRNSAKRRANHFGYAHLSESRWLFLREALLTSQMRLKCRLKFLAAFPSKGQEIDDKLPSDSS